MTPGDLIDWMINARSPRGHVTDIRSPGRALAWFVLIVGALVLLIGWPLLWGVMETP